MESRGMEAVASKSGRRKMGFKRKGGAPSIAIVVGAAPPKPAMEEDKGEEQEELVCPKCGATLADTPENREYAAKRSSEKEDGMMEADDEADDEEYA